MAAGTGIGAQSGANVQQDLLNHLTPASSTVATAVTITGPLKLALIVGSTDTTNTTIGTECSDANYSRQGITAWNAASTTAGNGSAVGITSKTSNTALTFGGAGGFAVAQSVRGVALMSSDATPVMCFYQNYASIVNVPVNNQLTFALGAVTAQIG